MGRKSKGALFIKGESAGRKHDRQMYDAKRSMGLYSKCVKLAIWSCSLNIAVGVALLGTGIFLPLPWIAPSFHSKEASLYGYYSVFLGLGMGLGIPLMAANALGLWRRNEFYSEYFYPYKRAITFGNLALALILIGFGLAMIFATNATGKVYEPGWRAYVSLINEDGSENWPAKFERDPEHAKWDRDNYNTQYMTTNGFSYDVSVAWCVAFGLMTEGHTMSQWEQSKTQLNFSPQNKGFTMVQKDQQVTKLNPEHLLFQPTISEFKGPIAENMAKLFIESNYEEAKLSGSYESSYCRNAKVRRAFQDQYGADRCTRQKLCQTTTDSCVIKNCDDGGNLYFLYVLLKMFRLEWEFGILCTVFGFLTIIFTAILFTVREYVEQPEAIVDNDEVEAFIKLKHNAQDHQLITEKMHEKGVRMYDIGVAMMGPNSNPFYPAPNPHGEVAPDENPFEKPLEHIRQEGSGLSGGNFHSGSEPARRKTTSVGSGSSRNIRETSHGIIVTPSRKTVSRGGSGSGRNIISPNSFDSIPEQSPRGFFPRSRKSDDYYPSRSSSLPPAATPRTPANHFDDWADDMHGHAFNYKHKASVAPSSAALSSPKWRGDDGIRNDNWADDMHGHAFGHQHKKSTSPSSAAMISPKGAGGGKAPNAFDGHRENPKSVATVREELHRKDAERRTRHANRVSSLPPADSNYRPTSPSYYKQPLSPSTSASRPPISPSHRDSPIYGKYHSGSTVASPMKGKVESTPKHRVSQMGGYLSKRRRVIADDWGSEPSSRSASSSSSARRY